MDISYGSPLRNPALSPSVCFRVILVATYAPRIPGGFSPSGPHLKRFESTNCRMFYVTVPPLLRHCYDLSKLLIIRLVLTRPYSKASGIQPDSSEYNVSPRRIDPGNPGAVPGAGYPCGTINPPGFSGCTSGIPFSSVASLVNHERKSCKPLRLHRKMITR